MMLRLLIAISLVVIAIKLEFQCGDRATLKAENEGLSRQIADLEHEVALRQKFLQLGNEKYNRLHARAELLEDEVARWESTTGPYSAERKPCEIEAVSR